MSTEMTDPARQLDTILADVSRALDDAAGGSSLAGAASAAKSRFRILRPHAAGGLGQVSVALDEELQREVALKEIRSQHADNPESRARFLKEAEVTGALEHPGIVPVYALGRYADGRPYYAMRFIRGDSLADALLRFHAPDQTRDPGARTLEMRQLIQRFIDVCYAVDYAHSRGVLHRDLKPENVMLGAYGETLVVDWGLAKLTGKPDNERAHELPVTSSSSVGSSASETVAGVAIGTPQYMSPEQAAGRLEELGPASDIYSLGATLYHLVTGSRPFEGYDLAQTLRSVETGMFPRPRERSSAVPVPLEAICLKAMALEPANRYASAHDLADDIEHWLADEPVTACRDSWGQWLARFCRRHRTWTQATATALVGVSVVSSFAVYVTRQERIVAERLASEKATLAADETLLRIGAERQAATLAFERALSDCLREDAGQGIVALAGCLPEVNRIGAADLEKSIRTQLAGWSRYVHPLRAMLRTDGKTSCVAFSPDGQRAATGDFQGRVQLWDAETGKPLGKPRLHQQAVSSVAFDESGKILLSASWDKTVRLRDAHTGEEREALLTHPDRVTAAAISPDGTTVVTGCADHQARIWDARTGALRGTMPHQDLVTAVAFSPNGRSIITGSHDHMARVWESATGRPIGQGIRHDQPVNAVAFAAGGKLVVTGTGDRQERTGVAQFWDPESGTPVGPPFPHQDTVESLAPSPDGTLLLTGSNDHTARLWDVADGRMVGPPMKLCGEVGSVAFSPDGDNLLTGSRSGSARIWKSALPRSISQSITHARSVTSVAYSPDGRNLLTASEDGQARLFQLDAAGNPGSEPHAAQSWSGNVAAFSPDGTTVWTGSSDRTVRHWTVSSGRPLGEPLTHPDGVNAVAVNRNETHLLTHCNNDVACLWQIDGDDRNRGRLVRQWNSTAAAFTPDGRRLLTGSRNGRVELVETSSGKAVGAPFVQQSAVVSVAISPDGGYGLAGYEDGTARCWTLETGTATGRPLKHHHRVIALAFSPDGAAILTGSEDNTARLWETQTGAQIGPPLKYQRTVSSVAFSPDGRQMLIGSFDRTARLWDMPVPVEGTIERVRLWSQVVTGLALESDGVLNVLKAPRWQSCRNCLDELAGPELP